MSHDIVGRQMAGPGIRYWHLAQVLAKHVPVTLAVPGSTTLSGVGLRLHPYQPDEWDTLRPVAEEAAVLMPCGGTLADFPALAEGGQPLVIDGYDPFTLETLALWTRQSLEYQDDRHQALLRLLRVQCQVGDFFLCASERQRDWWLGLLEAHGRINPRTYAADPTLRRLVDVVPFGLPGVTPGPARPVLKGIVPGIGHEDKVILWGGGIWEWLDPLTLIRAMPAVIEKEPNVRLAFPGTRHPYTDAVPDMPMRQNARQLAQDLQLLDRHVFFGQWVDYADWASYLLEADLAVSLHFDTVEAHLAFRSRVLDYVWVGLPMVVTCGDATSDMVAGYGLGRVVGFEDVGAVAAAVLELLNTPRDTWQTGFEKARSRLTWEKTAAPLVAFCKNPHRAADRPPDRSRSGLPVENTNNHKTQPAQDADELQRLRGLVAAYERGRFIRLMRRLHGMRRRALDHLPSFAGRRPS